MEVRSSEDDVEQDWLWLVQESPTGIGDEQQAPDEPSSQSTPASRPPYIRLYVATLLAIAFGISYSFTSIEAAIIVFALVTILLSFEIWRRNLIDRLQADQVYYTVAALLVAAAYSVEAPRREQHALQGKQLELQREIEGLQFNLDIVDFARKDAHSFLAIVKKKFQKEQNKIATAFDVDSCKEIVAARIYEYPSLDPSKEWLPYDEIFRLERKNLPADGALPCLHTSATLSRWEWGVARNLNSVAEYQRVAKFAERAFYLGTYDIETKHWFPMHILLVNSALFGDTEKPELDLDARAITLKESIDRLRKSSQELRNRKSEAEAEISAFRHTLGTFVYEYWPFLLIALLGLKLSRGSR